MTDNNPGSDTPRPSPLEVAKSCRIAIDSLREVRDRAVIAALAAGHGPSTVAQETGISRSFIRTIVEKRQAESSAIERTEGWSRPDSEPKPFDEDLAGPIFRPSEVDQ